MSITTLAEETHGALTLSEVLVTESGSDPHLAYDVWCEECGDFPVTACTEVEARQELVDHQHQPAVAEAVA